MCVCLPFQWQIDKDSLLDYVGFCVLWIAKTLHERELGFYPGRQHYPARKRVERNRPDEYCGCGSALRYRDCHRDADLRRSVEHRLWEEVQGRAAYLAQLDTQDRSRTIPDPIRKQLRSAA
jgi:hypothetical protein